MGPINVNKSRSYCSEALYKRPRVYVDYEV